MCHDILLSLIQLYHQEAYYQGYFGSNICKQLPNSPNSGSNSNDNGNDNGGGTPASP